MWFGLPHNSMRDTGGEKRYRVLDSNDITLPGTRCPEESRLKPHQKFLPLPNLIRRAGKHSGPPFNLEVNEKPPSISITIDQRENK